MATHGHGGGLDPLKPLTTSSTVLQGTLAGAARGEAFSWSGLPDDPAASFKKDSLGMSLGRLGHFDEPYEWSAGTTRGNS